MALAVLPSRNEPHYWNEGKVYMRNYTSSNPTGGHSQLNSRFNHNPNPSPNFSLSRQQVQNVSTLSHLRQGNVPTPALMANADAVDDRNDSFHREYVTFNLASYSRKELKDLKKRLVSDLGRVRGLLNRIDARDPVGQTPFQARNGVQPPPAPQLQLNQPALVEKPEKVGGKSKSKKLSGHKRALGLASSENPKRRPVVEGDKFFVSMMRRCKQILTKLMKHEHGWVFNTPVDVKTLNLYDYYDIIKHPMDLGTVKLRLERNEYRTPHDFAADVRLTFNNAMIYNPKRQDVHHMAEMLLHDFEETFKPVYKKYETEHQKATIKQRDLSQPAVVPPPNMLPVLKVDSVHAHSAQHQYQVHTLGPPPPVFTTPAVRSFPPETVVTPHSAKLPKPKAKDPNKREMTDEEKSKLGYDLQNLPLEKMEHMVQIVRRKNPNLPQEGDEIELDLAVLDNETLWELDRFITYHKKAMNKMRRQEVTEDAAEQLIKSPEKAPTQDHEMEKNKKGGEVGEEDVDIGEEIPIENFPPVQIEKDVPCVSSGSSSSSSSSSGSDSSSSGSGSSSSSDSDEDSVQSPFVEAKEAPAA